MNTEEYDVEARFPATTNKEEFQDMLRNLLVERFSLNAHREPRQVPVYDLVVAKDGPKLRKAEESSGAEVPPPPQTPPRFDRNGFPVLPPGRPALLTFFGQSGARLAARQQTMARFARWLSQTNAAGRYIVDKSGLNGEYDFTLEYDPRPLGQTALDSGVTLFEAVQRQLGLRLVDSKAVLDVIVIDHAERVPTGN